MGLFGGILKITEGVVKTGIGVAADIATLGTNAIEDETYTAKGLMDVKKGLNKTFED